MKNIVTRSISGAVYVGLIIAAVLAGKAWLLTLMSVFAVLGVIEINRLVCPQPQSTLRSVATAADCLAAVAIVAGLHYLPTPSVLFLIAYFLLRMTLALYDHGENPFRAVAWSFLSVLYLGIPLHMTGLYSDLTSGAGPLLLMFVMIWLNDTGAYLVGSRIGRRRLFERLSPKKSWEGFWGGMAFCVIAGIAARFILPGGSLSALIPSGASMGVLIGAGILTSVFSTWGDLFESLMKRNMGVKDSGHLIPGHGGILDRIDSLLFVAPASVIYIVLAIYLL